MSAYWECRSEGLTFSQEQGQTFEWFVAEGIAMVRCPSCGLALYRSEAVWQRLEQLVKDWAEVEGITELEAAERIGILLTPEQPPEAP